MADVTFVRSAPSPPLTGIGKRLTENLSRTALVIPTIRNISPDILAHVPRDMVLIIVEDREDGQVRVDHPNVLAFSYAERKRYWRANTDRLIARASSACRTFGYFVAWKEGFQYVLTLDDDCYARSDYWTSWWFNLPDPDCALSGSYSSNNGWINTLHILQKTGFARGLPFDNRDCLVKYDGGIKGEQIVAQVGLWSGCLDVCAVDKAIDDFPWKGESVDKEVPPVRVATDHVLPWSGMNYGFDIRILPLMMHWHACPFPVMDRYDDIWMGYLAKRVIDYVGDAVLVGGPIVDHVKEGDATKELRKERYVESISYWIYNMVDILLGRYKGDPTYLAIARYLGDGLRKESGRYAVPTMWRPYIEAMGHVLARWCGLLGSRRFGREETLAYRSGQYGVDITKIQRPDSHLQATADAQGGDPIPPAPDGR